MKSTAERSAVLVTGCSSGIGFAVALYLARRGFVVYATVRKEADAAKLQALAEPDLVPVWPLDLTDLGAVSRVRDDVTRDLRRRGLQGLYALVNNAGGGQVAPVELMDLERFRAELEVRALGAVAMVQAFLPALREGRGRILWIATPALVPTPYVASIHACDFAADCLARTLDIELKSWDIPNVQIRCGGIRTARGLETGADVEAILQHPSAELYDQQLREWGRDMAGFDRRRTDPERVAARVHAVLTARRPKRRYSVGHMARAAAFLELLPQSLGHRLLKMRF